MIPDFKTFIGESVWGDLARRSGGVQLRAEDDIDRLDRDEFYDYLKTRYSKLSHIISKDPSEIHITLGWSYFPKRDYKIDIHWVEQNKIKNLYLNFGQCELDSLCRKNFKIGTDNDGISNKEIISIIDFCLDYIKSQKYIESPINESIWGDLARRSGGTQLRAEDDIDNLDKEDFCDYLKENYKMLNSTYDIIVDNVYDGVCVNIYKLPGHERYSYLILKDFSREKSIELTDLYNKHMRDLLFGTYKVTINSEDNYIIESYDGCEITNTFYIEVLDFLLKNADHTHNPCVKKIRDIKESIWGDLARRSSGTQVRAEDDVNLLDCEEFCDYLKDRYECDMTKSYSGFSTNKTDKGGFMNIPLFVIPGKVFNDPGSFTYYTDEKCLAFGCSYTYYKMKCLKLLEEKCMTLDNITFDKRGYIKGDITNSLVIEFIDFILDNIKEPMIASIRRK